MDKIGWRKSLDELEKEIWAPGPSMLDTPAVKTELREKPGGMVKPEIQKPFSLNGSWEMIWDGTEEERLGPESVWAGSIYGEIPCSVHTALYENGVIPDPTVGLNDRIAREYSYKVWWMRKTFSWNKEQKDVRLFFEGICHWGKVWLNGHYLGEHKGMFGRAVFDAEPYLQKENTLVVKIENSPARPQPMSPYMDNDEGWHDGVVVNCVYGWHYACLPSRGIWAPVGLEKKTENFWCEKPFVSCRDAGRGIVDICLKVYGAEGKIRLHGEISGKNHTGPGGCFFAEGEITGENRTIHLETAIPDPRLWWPVNYGEPNLYRLCLKAEDESGRVQYFETDFGMRTIEMAPLPQGPCEEKYNWTFVVNGTPIFVKGSNWCTLDVLLRFNRERYRRFLTLAKEQNLQLLRAWGGGMPESEDFYELCDELGIMVIQEWPTCWDSQKEQPFEELEETVLTHMPRLRNHPSLIMWCGGNESSRADGPAMDMMARYAYELDGSRCFHRTSPWGGAIHDYATYWDMQDIDVSVNLRSPFMGEFGMASAPNLSSVRRYVPAPEMKEWPPKRFGSFGHHTPRFNQLEPNDMEHLSKRVPEFTARDTMEGFIWGTQMAQATAVRHTLEAYRCAWPEATGICYYKLTDVYPACSWSTVDYYGVQKLSYYVIQDSYEPLHPCLLFRSLRVSRDTRVPVYLLDDAGALQEKSWKVRVRSFDGGLKRLSEKSYEGSGGRSVMFLGQYEIQKKEIGDGPLLITAELWDDGKKKNQVFYWLNYQEQRGCLERLPETSLCYTASDGKLHIKNTGEYPAVGVTVACSRSDMEFSAEDSVFWLDPQEERTLWVSHTEGLEICAWNVRESLETKR